jgi:hypothetical protein
MSMPHRKFILHPYALPLVVLDRSIEGLFHLPYLGWLCLTQAPKMNLSNFLLVTLIPVNRVLRPSDVPTLRTTVENTAQHPITTLNYNTLLDKAAGILGILHMVDSSAGKEASADVIKFRKVWPPTREAFVEIVPGAKFEVDIPLRTHKLEPGRT